MSQFALNDGGHAGHRPSILALVTISMLSPIGINIIVPSLPGIQRHFQAEFGTVQLAVSSPARGSPR